MQVFSLSERAALWTDAAKAQIGSLASTGLLLGPAPAGGITGLQLLDLETYLPGDLLPKSDIASMAHSLELRSPLLDHRVVELGLSLPDSLKQQGRQGKIALRRAFAADLPPIVAERGKTGFGLPLARWFRDELRPLARDVLLDDRARARGWFDMRTIEGLLGDHTAGRADNGHRLWALTMLELWQRTYVDTSSSPPAAVAR
jgi:asparagine synthase (glutamine-hydrolysing)